MIVTLCTQCMLPTEPKIKRKRKRQGRSNCCNARWYKINIQEAILGNE